MADSGLLQQISLKESNKEEIAAAVIERPDLLEELFEGLNSDKASVKYGCEKVLRIISEKAPSVLYPWIDFFIDLLDSEDNFLKWGAIFVIANLAAVDSERKFEGIFDRYFEPIRGPVLIAAANVVKAAARIALAKPELADRIAGDLLKVEEATYQTAACRDIALGHAIDSLDRFFDRLEDKQPVEEFIRRQQENPRNATRRRAEAFVKKHQIAAA